MIVAGEPFPSLRFWAELRFVRRVSMQCRFRLLIDSLYLLTFLSCLSLAAFCCHIHTIVSYRYFVCSGCCTVVDETSSIVPHRSHDFHL